MSSMLGLVRRPYYQYMPSMKPVLTRLRGEALASHFPMGATGYPVSGLPGYGEFVSPAVTRLNLTASGIYLGSDQNIHPASPSASPASPVAKGKKRIKAKQDKAKIISS